MVDPAAVKCPECGFERVFKDGLRHFPNGESIQRWLCRECGFRFTERNPDESLERPLRKNSCWQINSGSDSFLSRQVCELLTEESKNLTEVTRQEQTQREGTDTRQQIHNICIGNINNPELKGKLVEFSWFMHKEGLKLQTVQGRVDCIRNLINLGANIHDPEDVKRVIADQEKWGDGYKRNVVISYTTYLAMLNRTWHPPKYRRTDRLPFIPLESELDQLIGSCGKRTSTFLQTLKETGGDPGEIGGLEWIDINTEKRAITINHPVKGHKARIINVSKELIDRLNSLPKTQTRVFNAKLKSIQKNFYEQRKTATRKFSNTRLLKICFTTFRHWKATMEYHRTRDILWVMRLLGHCSIRTTMVYIDIETALFKQTDDEFTVRVADSLPEACKLLETGFEYVCEMDGKNIFRKRK
jgi:rubredoxin